MLLSCCWSSACCCISGKAAAAGYCANFWARDSLLSIAKSAGKPEGRAEENDGGAPARLGVAMENMGVDKLLLSPGVCMGKLFRDITGVDRGWSCPEAPLIPCLLGWRCRKERTKLANKKGEVLSIVYETGLAVIPAKKKLQKKEVFPTSYHLPCCWASVRNVYLQGRPAEVGRRSGSLWVRWHRIPSTASNPRGCGKWAIISLNWTRSNTSSVKFSCCNELRHVLSIA